MTTMFFSYESKVENLIAGIAHHFQRRTNVEPYFYPDRKTAGFFSEHLIDAINEASFFVLFISDETSSSTWQEKEIKQWMEGNRDKFLCHTAIVRISERSASPSIEEMIRNFNAIKYCHSINQSAIHDICTELIGLFSLPNSSFDDLPISPLVTSEKKLIDDYAKGGGRANAEMVSQGFPESWPAVPKLHKQHDTNIRLIKNPLESTVHGQHRSDNAKILVDARDRSTPLAPPISEDLKGALETINPAGPGLGEENSSVEYDRYLPLTFLEAGPREHIFANPIDNKVGFIVSGGIAPGINAVLAAIIQRHLDYKTALLNTAAQSHDSDFRHYTVRFSGFAEGFKSLSNDGRIFQLSSQNIDQLNRWTSRAASWLPTARFEDFLDEDLTKREEAYKEAVHTIYNNNIDILYIIGGEGTMRAIHALYTVYKEMYPKEAIRFIGIPKTMDNDILFMWQSFGFETAVGEAERASLHLAYEVNSNPRLAIMQLFGSNSGFVASHAAVANRFCDLVLIPELGNATMEDICRYIESKLTSRLRYARKRPGIERAPYGLIIMAETFLPQDYSKYLEYVELTPDERQAVNDYDEKREGMTGQTPDALRSGALKILVGVLQKHINDRMGEQDDYWRNFRIVTNEPRHLIRSTEPAPMDIILAGRLGTMAVDAAMAGFTDCMVSSWLTEYVVVPLKLVVLGRKRVQREGIFWKNVVATTHQSEEPNLA